MNPSVYVTCVQITSSRVALQHGVLQRKSTVHKGYARFGMTPEFGVATSATCFIANLRYFVYIVSGWPSLKQYTFVLAKHHSHMMIDIMS